MSLTIESSVQIVNQLSVSMEVGLAVIDKTVPVEQLTVAPSTATVEYYPSSGHYFDKVTANAVTNEIDSNIASENIRSGISILGVEGSPTVVNTANATAIASDIQSGKTAYVNGVKIVGEIESYSVSAPIMPTTADQTLHTANKYVETDIVVKGDSKLLPDNIKENTTIFGVEGTVKPQNNGYQRVEGVPNGEEIIANAPDIEQGGITYKPIYYICAMDTFNSVTFSKTATGRATGADAYVFSDEPTTLYVGASVAHTFDATKDFDTSESWNCRYVIMYATAANKNNANGITVNLYNYRATFEMIGASGTIFNTYITLFGSDSITYQSIKYVDISNCSFRNNTVGYDFFRNCSSLAGIKLPESLTTVGNYFCYYCQVLTTLSLPNLTTVGKYFCGTCSSLAELSLPNLTTPGSSFCASCSSLAKLSLPALTTNSGSSFCAYSFSLAELSLPALTTNSGSSFCASCYSLTNIDLSSITNFTNTTTSTLAYCRFITLPVDFDINGVNFTGATNYTKSLDWLNNELPTKLKDNSDGTAKTMTLGAANIAMISAEAAAIIAAKNWTVT